MYPELFSIGSFTVNSYGVMMALAFLAGGFVGRWQFGKRGVRPDFVWILVIAAIVGGLLGAKIHQREAVLRAVILAEEAVARSGPGPDYLQVFSVHEGTAVVIEREEADWTLVRLPNGVGGWVPGESLEAI